MNKIELAAATSAEDYGPLEVNTAVSPVAILEVGWCSVEVICDNAVDLARAAYDAGFRPQESSDQEFAGSTDTMSISRLLDHTAALV